MSASEKNLKTHSIRGAARFSFGIAALLAAASLLNPGSAMAGLFRNETPPSTPGNFHATSVTESNVTFAWTASKTGSDPSFVYEIVNETTGLILNVGRVTSYTWAEVQAGGTYSFYIFAVDSDEKASADSPTVTVTLPGPPPPPPPVQPEAPIITVTSATSDTITVSWTEETPGSEIGGYEILVNGAEGGGSASSLEATVGNLSPDTTYTINVVAFSTGGTLSATSAPVTVTTATPPNTTPPTAPTDLTGFGDGGGEAIISWNPSTSVNEPQSQIFYKIYINGVFDSFDSTVGQTEQVYIFPRGATVPAQVYVVAADQYGNASAPSNILTLEGF